MKQQDYLRQQVKLAKALNDDWSFRAMSEVIQISPNAFYNWLNGYQKLSQKKARELLSLVDDLLA